MDDGMNFLDKMIQSLLVQNMLWKLKCLFFLSLNIDHIKNQNQLT